MRDRTRRLEFWKMLIDVAKYVVTIVVVGGLFSERLNFGSIVLGAILAIGFVTIGFHVMPPEED